MTVTATQERARPCSIARALDVLGEKWALLAVREMMLGTHRFTEMIRNTGAPRDILTTRLRALETRGLLERRQYSTRPDRFEYHLTELGQSLHPVITVLRQWGDDHLSDTNGPPATFTHSCGRDLQAALVCAHCGKSASDSAPSALHGSKP